MFDVSGEEIWWGDLDLTTSMPRWQSLAEEIGKVFVTPGQPWRFDGLEDTCEKEGWGGVLELSAGSPLVFHEYEAGSPSRIPLVWTDGVPRVI